MTKKLLLAAAVLAALGARPAAAADMLLKAPPPAPVYSWTGFYLGGNIGYSWGLSDPNVNFFDASAFQIARADGSFGMQGVIGGGQAGFNFQAGRWVVGAETDIQASGQRGTGNFPCAAGICSTSGLQVNEALTQKLEWFGTARGRLGFTITPTLLLYGTGGLAYGEVVTNGVISDPASFSQNNLKTGWAAGGGIEAGLSRNWTVKLEYLYMDLGDVSSNGLTATGILGPGVPHNGPPIANHLTTSFSASGPGITDNILRLGANYKF